TVNWHDMPPASSYRIRWRKNNGSWSSPSTVSGSQFTHSVSDGAWDYQVASCIGGTCTAYSGYVRIYVLQAPTLNAPSTANAYTYFSVGWNAVANVTRYQLQRNGTTKQNNSLT